MSAKLEGTFDPEKLTVVIGGVIISGFSDGDSITVKRDEDLYFKRVGTNGDVGRARNANKSGSIEIRLLQVSEVNDQLSTLFSIDNLVADGKIVLPIAVTDLSGRSVFAATQCWLKTLPEGVFNREVAERVWVFDCADLRMYHGGNEV